MPENRFARFLNQLPHWFVALLLLVPLAGLAKLFPKQASEFLVLAASTIGLIQGFLKASPSASSPGAPQAPTQDKPRSQSNETEAQVVSNG